MSIDDINGITFKTFMEYFESSYEKDKERAVAEGPETFFSVLIQKAKEHRDNFERVYGAASYNANLKKYTKYSLTPLQKITVDKTRWHNSKRVRRRCYFPAGDWTNEVNSVLEERRAAGIQDNTGFLRAKCTFSA